MVFLDSYRSWWVAVGIAVILSFLFFVRLGGIALLDPDEPVYGQVAHEMVDSGDWLTPHYMGHPWFDKPPMFYWLSALSVAIFGINEFSCRLPSALTAIGVALLTGLLARVLFGPRAFLTSLLVQATSLQHLILARSAVTDMTLAFFLTASLLTYALWRSTDGRELRWAVVCGAAIGGAVLTKGPVGLVLPAAIFALDILVGRNRRLFQPLAYAVVLGTGLLVSLPWYVMMWHLHGKAFLQGFLVANNLTRFLAAEHPESSQAYYFLPVLIGFFFPWSAHLPWAIRHSLTPESRAATRLLLLWAGIIFLFFSASQTKLVTYIFPIYPALSVLVGDFWAGIMEKEASQMSARKAVMAMTVLGAALGLFLVMVAHLNYVEAFRAALGLSLCLILGSVAALTGIRRDANRFGFGAIIAMMTIFIGIMVSSLGPIVEKSHTTKALVYQAARLVGDHIYAYQLSSQSLYFYTDGKAQWVGAEKEVMRLSRQNQPAAFIASQKSFTRLSPDIRSRIQVIASTPKLVLFAVAPWAGRSGAVVGD